MTWSMKPVLGRDDAERVAALAKTIWNEHYGKLLGKGQVAYMLAQFQSCEAILRQIGEEGYRYYLLYSDEETAGYVGVHAGEDGGLFLSKLYVLEGFRGKGLAAWIIVRLEELCLAAGLSRMWLTVNKGNASSIAAYAHLGFEMTGSQVTDIGAGYVMDDYLMERAVPIAAPKEGGGDDLAAGTKRR